MKQQVKFFLLFFFLPPTKLPTLKSFDDVVVLGICQKLTSGLVAEKQKFPLPPEIMCTFRSLNRKEAGFLFRKVSIMFN